MADLPEIEVTETGVTIDGETIAYDEVETVAYLRSPVNGSGALLDIVRRFELAGAGRRVGTKLDGAVVLAKEKEQRWRNLVGVCQHWIEPRLRDQALDRITRHGGTVRIGKLELGPDGFASRSTLRAKRYPWAEYQEAYYATSRIQVMATPDGDKERKVLSMHTDVPNAVLLPRLMTDVAAIVNRTAP